LGEPEEDPRALEAMRIVWDSCHFNPRRSAPFDVERGRQLWREALASVPPGKVPVFSKETLTMPEYYVSPDDGRVAARLFQLTGPARIVIMVRHQVRMIESLYLVQTKGPRYMAPSEWLASKRKGTALLLYSYHAMAARFAEHFGRENVGVFALENLKSDVADFTRRLCSFIGIDAERALDLLRNERRNRRVSQRYLIYSKLRKRMGLYMPIGAMLPRAVREAFNSFVRGGSEASFELPPRLRAEVESLYREDNRRLAEEWQLPLKQYGYPL